MTPYESQFSVIKFIFFWGNHYPPQFEPRSATWIVRFAKFSGVRSGPKGLLLYGAQPTAGLVRWGCSWKSTMWVIEILFFWGHLKQWVCNSITDLVTIIHKWLPQKITTYSCYHLLVFCSRFYPGCSAIFIRRWEILQENPWIFWWQNFWL